MDAERRSELRRYYSLTDNDDVLELLDELEAAEVDRDASEARAEEAEAERDRLREALEVVESYATSDSLCVMCDCDVNHHAADCVIGRALNRPECREVGDE